MTCFSVTPPRSSWADRGRWERTPISTRILNRARMVRDSSGGLYDREPGSRADVCHVPTEEELLSAIDAEPEADAPRLAHADWLEANGDPERAAYVRSSLRSERDTFHRWVGGLPTVHGMAWECRRGYPEVV